MPEQWETADDVHRQLARAFGPEAEFDLYPCEFGWVARRVLPATEPEVELNVGQGNFVVNRRTGVVTAHGSLHPMMVGEMYDDDIRAGEPVQGYQVYPPMWEIEVERVRETPAEIAYRVRGRSLTDPPDPESPVQQILTIDKRTFQYHTDSGEIHVSTSHAAGWVERGLRRDDRWPAAGSLRG